jgi:hypothetical protein
MMIKIPIYNLEKENAFLFNDSTELNTTSCSQSYILQISYEFHSDVLSHSFTPLFLKMPIPFSPPDVAALDGSCGGFPR